MQDLNITNFKFWCKYLSLEAVKWFRWQVWQLRYVPLLRNQNITVHSAKGYAVKHKQLFQIYIYFASVKYKISAVLLSISAGGV